MPRARQIGKWLVAAETAPNIEALNHATALDFYTTQAGFSEERALQHIGGIDLSRPVDVVKLDPDTTLQQYVRPGRLGNYFARVGTTPLESGLSVTDQTLTIFRNDSTVSALRSTAKGYVWHHVEDGATMQLIPKTVHNSVRHTGGAAVIRNGGFD